MYSPPQHTHNRKLHVLLLKLHVGDAPTYIFIKILIYCLKSIQTDTLTLSDVSFQFSVKCKVGVKVLAKKEDFK